MIARDHVANLVTELEDKSIEVLLVNLSSFTRDPACDRDLLYLTQVTSSIGNNLVVISNALSCINIFLKPLKPVKKPTLSTFIKTVLEN